MAYSPVIKRILTLIIGPVLIGLVGIGVYLQGGRFVSTENAYLKSAIIAVSSEISGKVLQVAIEDNARVREGDLVLRLYDEPLQIPVAKAEANLANIHGDLEGQKAEYESKKLEINSAQTDFEFREVELQRLQQLLEEKSVSLAQFDKAEFELQDALNELKAKTQAAKIIEARLIDPYQSVKKHPRYLQAMAELDNARLDLSYTEVHSPADGIAANVSAHIGENIIAGTNLFNLIDDKQRWIEANFKETDLTYVRVGQPVLIEIDTYPDAEWQGHVASITPATGSEFSLLPAQNSSGNWVKVVQRIMVKIALDDDDRDFPLSTGMSASVSIDTKRIRSLPWLNETLTELLREF